MNICHLTRKKEIQCNSCKEFCEKNARTSLDFKEIFYLFDPFSSFSFPQIAVFQLRDALLTAMTSSLLWLLLCLLLPALLLNLITYPSCSPAPTVGTPSSSSSLKVAVVADLHLAGPGTHWFDRFRRESFLESTFRVLHPTFSLDSPPPPPSPLPFFSGVGWLEHFPLCTSSENEGQRNQLGSSSNPNGSPVKRKGRRKFSRDFSFELCFLHQSSNLWRLRVYHKALDLALMLKLWFVPPYF
jgi:hypothetical protein